MEKEVLSIIRENDLSPFSSERLYSRSDSSGIFKTKDAKLIHTKLLEKISSNFNFDDTSRIPKLLSFTQNSEEIKKRQEFFRTLPKGIDYSFLNKIKKPKSSWKPKYQSIVVTEDESTLSELRRIGCPVQFIINSDDVRSLESYDIVQVIDCEQSSLALESLPQTVFLKSLDEAYLERYVELLSSWKDNLEILKRDKTLHQIDSLVSDISNLFYLINSDSGSKITRQYLEVSVKKINEDISLYVKQMTLSGESLLSMLSQKSLSPELQSIIKTAIEKTSLPASLFNREIPVSIDEAEFDKLLRQQDAIEHTNMAEEIKGRAKELKALPEKLQKLSEFILFLDFIAGISAFMFDKTYFPDIRNELKLSNVKNIFIEQAKPISFHLNEQFRCSILTGANSGGKTTLLEHIIQLISLFQLGIPTDGNFSLPIFTDIYYFAKNKGSASKGAFETLLTQMSEIRPGNKTLILADEIEAVTEPGVAGKIICATANYFIKRGCFLVIATHLGQEIQKNLPQYARIDGIEAKGLDENFELIVDHNPVLGRLAHSTPELIVDKMANSTKQEYFTYLQAYLKGNIRF